MTNMELITATTLSTSAASVTFSSIPQTYNDLVLRISARTDASAYYTPASVTVNGDTSSYSYTNIQSNGTSPSSGRASNTTNWLSAMDATTSTSNTFSSNEIYIPKYTSSAYKVAKIDEFTENNGTYAFMRMNAALWSINSAITSITISVSGVNIVSGSTFRLYGISNT